MLTYIHELLSHEYMLVHMHNGHKGGNKDTRMQMRIYADIWASIQVHVLAHVHDT